MKGVGKGNHDNHARGPISGTYRHGEVQRINGKRVASPEYNTWQLMKNRCLNPDAWDWKYYGGKGIGIDDSRWCEFKYFLLDMGRRPHHLLTLERKDGTKGYCKSNCEWATRAVQSRNRAYAKLTVAKAAEIRARYKTGVFTQQQLATEYGVTQTCISHIIVGRAWRLEGKQ